MGKENVHLSVLGKHQAFIWKYPYSKAPYGIRVDFVTTRAIFIPTNKNLASEIAPHISSALRYLGVLFDISILSSIHKLVNADFAGTLDS